MELNLRKSHSMKPLSMKRRQSGPDNKVVYIVRERVNCTPKRSKIRDPIEVEIENDRIFEKWLLFAIASLLVFISVGRAIELSIPQMTILTILAGVGAIISAHIQKRC